MKENFKKEKEKKEKYQLLNEKLQNILTENHEEKKSKLLFVFIFD